MAIDPLTAKLLAQAAARAATDEESRRRTLILILAPILGLLLLIAFILYLITSPFSMLSQWLVGDEVSVVENFQKEYGYNQQLGIYEKDYIEGSGQSYEGVVFTDGGREVIYYNQLDERWADTMYGTSGTIGEAGCGPTAMAIVTSTLTGTPHDPVELSEWSVANGHRCEGNGSYSDPSVLWNSVEMRESKSAKAQLARSYKINLPNEWSYELAIEVMRDYVKRNFVDDGMCAQFAIHDSENPNTHQRNLHCHIMLTMRPILEDGSWGDKQKKIYALDADGNKIRKKNGQYKCTTQDVTGWNSRENARKWRKDLADTINAVNDKNGLRENFWEHRSFAEQGLDTIPQIHLGEKASALERAGIQTERGNVNRRIMEQNKAILTAKMLVAKAEEQLQKLVNSKPVEAVRNTANEVLDMIRAVVGKKGRLELPVIKSKYLRKISQRQALQEQERMERFVVVNQIESFEQLQEFKEQREPAYEKLSAERQQIAEQIARLEQLLVAYSEYEPYIVYHKTSNSLKGFAKRKYDKEHETELREYDSYRAKLKKMLSSDEKITPKKWTAEKTKLEERLQESNPDYARVVTELASTEVIEHNRKMLAMTREAEQNQRSQIHSRKKNEQSL